MSCALIKTRSFTMIEMLVAVLIASAFLGGVYSSYIQIHKAHDRAEARIEAMRNGRTALMTLSEELKSINRLGADFLIVGLDAALAFGDGRDNDGDDLFDEEKVDGLDNDGDAPVDDTGRHAIIGNLRERPLFEGRTDMGDLGVDEDVNYGRDRIIFRIFPRTTTENLLLKTVTLAVTEFDGQSDVLVRQTVIEREGQEPLVGLAPLAFDVKGFDLLYWDPNATPEFQGWVETWDSSEVANFDPPRLPLPASIYARLTLRADPLPGELTPDGAPLQTVILETIVNIEETINDARYPRPSL